MLIDSNILIYALNRDSPQHKTAQQFLQRQDELLFTQQNIFETLRILTHSKFSNPFPPSQAVEAVQLITSQSTVIFPTIDTTAIACALIEKYRITGSEIFDAYLVATALSNDIKQIATDNTKHLKKYKEIQVHNPLKG